MTMKTNATTKIAERIVSQEIYNNLVDALLKYEEQYYGTGESEISDAEFDSLYIEAQKIEEQHPEWIREDTPTRRVMGDSVNSLEKVSHNTPMLSLDKAMDFEELQAYIKKINGVSDSLVVECKHDGLACRLSYADGKFRFAATRGNGIIGNDVTASAKLIPNIPKVIKDKSSFDVYGEVFLTKSGLKKINEQLDKEGSKERRLKNVRNSASGIFKTLNPERKKLKYMKFAAYTLVDHNNMPKSHKEAMDMLHNLGFEVTGDFVPSIVINNKQSADKVLTDIKEHVDNVYEQRPSLDFEIDGMVVKVNEFNKQDQLGETEKFPNWAIAYKFPQEEKVSILRGVEWRFGSKGTITPVAIIDPVDILGATVTNPTLHNIDEIERLELKIGDHIVVTRRGDVIPKIVRNMKELRTGEEQAIEVPEFCPMCGRQLVKDNAFLKCNNASCTGHIEGRIEQFVTKLDIKDIGDKLISVLVDKEILKTPADLFTLQIDDIANLDKMGEKSAQKIIDHIHSKIPSPLYKIIAGLAIPGVGDQTGKLLAKKYKSLKNLLNANYTDLIEISDLGPVTANNIVVWINANKDFINRLINLNIDMYEEDTEGVLNKHTFAFTGALSIPRKKMEEIIADNGGTVFSIKKGLDYLIIGDGAKDHKIEKAKKYNAQVITESEFMTMLNED